MDVNYYLLGDVNNDGSTDLADAVCIINHYIGKAVPVFLEEAADVDYDGTIDIADAVRIVNLVIGKITILSHHGPNVLSIPESESLPEPQ
jgi:hypothetical protein